MATRVKTGTVIDYTPGAAVTAGDVVVVGGIVGVAEVDLAAGELGALAIDGIFRFDKATGGGTAIAAGSLVYYDEAEGVVKTDDESGANSLAGTTVAASADGDATVLVKLHR